VAASFFHIAPRLSQKAPPFFKKAALFEKIYARFFQNDARFISRSAALFSIVGRFNALGHALQHVVQDFGRVTGSSGAR
jgi:hypothetical protein